MKIGIADTTFARVDMAKFAIETIKKSSEAKTEKEMYSIAKNRAEKHALNALALLKGKTELTRCAGMGRRQGKDDDGPIKIKWQKS